jgi:hypothetical protein
MAVIFQKNMRNMFINAICNTGLAGANPVNTPPASIDVTFTIYGGTQPTAADIVANWPSYYNTFLLNLPTAANVYQPNAGVVDTGVSLFNTGLPTSQTSNAAGTAEWAIMWGASGYDPLSHPTTIPDTKFIVVPVSNTSGTAPLRLASTTIAAATSYTIADFSLTSAGGIA